MKAFVWLTVYMCDFGCKSRHLTLNIKNACFCWQNFFFFLPGGAGWILSVYVHPNQYKALVTFGLLNCFNFSMGIFVGLPRADFLEHNNDALFLVRDLERLGAVVCCDTKNSQIYSLHLILKSIARPRTLQETPEQNQSCLPFSETNEELPERFKFLFLKSASFRLLVGSHSTKCGFVRGRA